MLNLDTPSDREIQFVRTFRAPRTRVWQAFTHPALLAQWWGRGHPVDVEEFQLARDGRWRFVERAPDGVTGFYGHFRAIEPEKRIEQTFAWDRMAGTPAVTESFFEDLGDGRTRVTTRILFATAEERDQMIETMPEGLEESYAALDKLLPTLQ